MTMITDFAPSRLRMTPRRRSPIEAVMTGIRVMRERARLSRMTEEELADIGLTIEQANKEVSRPIWDLPANR